MNFNRLFGWAIFLIVLITPRIQIIPISGSFIRLEDILFVINFFWLIVNRNIFHNMPKYLVTLFKTLIVMSTIGIFSSLFSYASDRNSLVTGFLYSLRPIEYASLVPTIYILIKSSLFGINKVLQILTLTTFVTSILQTFLSLQIGTRRFGFTRSSALTGGPYELAMISILLLLYWLYKRKYLFVLICTISLIASASRISIFALGFALIIFVLGRVSGVKNRSEVHYEKSGRFYRFFLVFLIILLTSIASSFSEKFNQPLVKYESRLQSTEASLFTLKESYALAKSTPSISSSQQYSEIIFDSPPDFTGGFESSDASTRRRYFVWFVLLNTFIDSKSFFWGLGPGFAGSAVDGNYVRIIAEYGLLGLVIYWKWFSILLRRSTYWLRAAICSVLVTGVYIDIFTSIKTALLIYVFFLLNQHENSEIFLLKNPHEKS